MLAGVDAGDLLVLVLVVDDRESLHHAWVNSTGLVRCRRRRVIWECVHQRCGQRSAVLGNPDSLGLFQAVAAVVGLETQDWQALDVDLGYA